MDFASHIQSPTQIFFFGNKLAKAKTIGNVGKRRVMWGNLLRLGS
jgi:hypothetical protein